MRTTIKLKGKEFAVYETKRAYYDFEQAGYSIVDVARGKMTAIMAFAYYAVKACCKRENVNFPYPSLEIFVDDDEIDMDELSRIFTDVNKREEKAAEGEA